MDTKGARELEDRIRDLTEGGVIELYENGLPHMRIYGTEDGPVLYVSGLTVHFYNVSRTAGTIDLYRGRCRVATLFTSGLEVKE